MMTRTHSAAFLALALAGQLSSARANVLWNDVCTQPDTKDTKWCDTSATIAERAAAFVAALKPDEKVPIMTNEAQGVKRLHIPPYQWGSEGLHGPLEPCVCGPSKASGGNVKCACPTSFPAPSAMASAFNNSLYWLVGHHDGIEARAINNLRNHETQNNYGDGIDYWSPTVNMQVPGEDPELTGQYAANFVQGLQGSPVPEYPSGVDPTGKTMIVACCKHFIANSLEGGNAADDGNTRHNFNAKVPLDALADYYLPAFKGCVMEGKVKGIMCSYNAVNGVPMCANSKLLNETLRNTWGFDGDAVGDVYTPEPAGHGYASPLDGVAMSLKAGTDMDCGDWGKRAYLTQLPSAVKAGKVKEADLDRALVRLTTLQMELGLFDPKANSHFFTLGVDLIHSDEHTRHALEAAQQSIVLLKNQQVLPLKKGGKIAVLGPHSDGHDVFLSNYHGSGCLNVTGGIGGGKSFDCIQSPLNAIKAANVGGTTVGVEGVGVKGPPKDPKQDMTAALAAATAADSVVLVMGIDGTVEGEAHDRANTTLPGTQPDLVKAVLALNKPTVLVLVHGGAMSLGQLKDSAPAILDCFYGGEMAAQAMADVLFGDYNPSGKLAVTMYPPEYVDQIAIEEMSLTVPPGRTHMYYTGVPEFKFGDGMSYTSFQLGWHHSSNMSSSNMVSVSLSTTVGSTAQFKVKVANVGERHGRVTVLAMWRPVGHHAHLQQKLFGFDGLILSAGASGTLTFDLPVEKLVVADANGDRSVNPGDYEVFFKAGSDSEELLGQVTVDGPVRVVESSSF